MLQRNYFFEFAGMPQSGKSTVVDIVAHFLKRSGYPLGEYRGGSRYSPLYNAPIGVLNLSLACKTADFVVSTLGAVPHKIYLLDRGLIDRCIFTEALRHAGQIDVSVAQRITDFLTLPRLREALDGVFIFTTSPELALERENAIKLVETKGQVMNSSFLSTLRLATIDGCSKARDLHIPNVCSFDTEQLDGEIRAIAADIVNNILRTIGEEQSRIDISYFQRIPTYGL
jgi:hypothetical protein